MPPQFTPCVIKELPPDKQIDAALAAQKINPTNAPMLQGALQTLNAIPDAASALLDAQRIAVLTSKYWGARGVDLTVEFMEPIPAELRDRILFHMNACGGQTANIKFRHVARDGQVRLTREQQGYWSYLGTDILQIPRSQATMCLGGFSISTPESEHRRVTRHETLHTCGCPHEHLRAEVVSRIDPAKAIAYFARMGWSEATTRSNVLTPLSAASIRGTPTAQEDSIMCYQLPGSITRDGSPIIGGTDITAEDAAFLASIYPVTTVNPGPGPGPSGKRGEIILEVACSALTDVKIVGVKQLNVAADRLDVSKLSLEDLVSIWNLLHKAIALWRKTSTEAGVVKKRVVLDVTGDVQAAVVKSIT